MQPLRFDFRVNRSFLEYAEHPITIPRSQLPYSLLRQAGLSSGGIEIRFAGVLRLDSLYRGTAGYGEYYQLRVTDGPGLPTGTVNLGQRLRIELGKDGPWQFANVTAV